ncbi:unnamed protein product [Taenia asiatica]|uniref:Uncharacterized protein n=1 Tax=Taenia asiatica TaxID=60517 RepID=A0A3P6PTI9_TAEAS|nr:unnamed protein product [Taenia asiatica]
MTSFSSRNGRWTWLVCGCVLVIALLIHGMNVKGIRLRIQVPRNILSQVDENMKNLDSSAIHIMQMVVGSNAPRFQIVFLKSLFLHHFEKGKPNPAPIHLHFLTDNATRVIIEGILESWRLNHIRHTFYPAEPIQVLLLDSDTVFMTDVVELWQHFDRFGKSQILGMAKEQAIVRFDFTRFGSNKRSFGYNAGVMMWYMQRLTQTKWDSIWQPTFKLALKVYNLLPAAEQTLINAVTVQNPDILYPLPCTWNLQMYERVNSEDCLSTWNRPPGDGISEPKLLHADRFDKLETQFYLEENHELAKNVVDITNRYIAIRSQYHMKNGYQFRYQPIEAPVFDFRKVMSRLHPDGQVMSPTKLCLSKWQIFSPWCDNSKQFVFTIDHRLHPLYVSQDHKKLMENSCNVTLAVSLDINNFDKFRSLSTHWNGFISAAVYATDQEAHTLLIKIDSSTELKNRSDIFYHVVYRNSSFPESVALHNTAVVYSQTRRVLLISHLDVNIADLNAVVRMNLAQERPADTVVIVGGGNFDCSFTHGRFCALKEGSIFGRSVGARKGINF